MLSLLPPGWVPGLAWLGLLAALWLLLSLMAGLRAGWRAFILPRLATQPDLRAQYGNWALVTGCTGGIGREYALGLARRGLNVVLASRSRAKLSQLESEVVGLGVRTLIVVADFTSSNAANEVAEAVERAGIQLGVLVNNVGILGPHYQPFLDMEPKLIVDMLTVNITAATLLTRRLLPAMVAAGRGAVINISSSAAYHPIPYLAEYAATKHYLHAWNQALATELAGSGITVQEVNPGPVATPMTELFDPDAVDFFRPTADTFVRSALLSLGWVDRTNGYWKHGLLWPFDCITPAPLSRLIMLHSGRQNWQYAVKQLAKSK